MAEWCKDLLRNKQVVCAYYAVVLVLVILVFMQVWRIGYHFNENLENRQNYIYTSGANQRVYGQEFSGANQGEFTTGYNVMVDSEKYFQKKEDEAAVAAEASATDAGLSGEEATEKLTATVGQGPDTWAVGHDLYAYKAGISGQTEGLAPGRQGMNMQNMTTENMQDDMYEQLLHGSLLAGA